MADSPPTQQRWYDKDPVLYKVVQQMHDMPHEVLSILAHGIIRYAEHDSYLRDCLEKCRKNLSKEKVLGLHKAQQRKRWHDSHTMTRELFKNLYILNPKEQRFIADKSTDLILMIQLYLSQCKLYNQKVSLTNITMMTEMYLMEGKPEEVKKFLIAFQAQFGPQAEKDQLGTIEESMYVKRVAKG